MVSATADAIQGMHTSPAVQLGSVDHICEMQQHTEQT